MKKKQQSGLTYVVDQVIGELDELGAVEAPLPEYIEALEEIAGIVAARIEAAQEDVDRGKT